MEKIPASHPDSQNNRTHNESSVSEHNIETTKTSISDRIQKITKEKESVFETLRDLTNGNFFSAETINTILQSLPGVHVFIPDKEMEYINTLMPQTLTPETVQHIQSLQENTENDIAPFAVQLPRVVNINGKEKPFTVETFNEIIIKASRTETLPRNNNTFRPIIIDDHVPQEIYHTAYVPKIRVYTPTSLKNSKDKSFKDQCTLQKDVCPTPKMRTDAVLAFALKNLIKPDTLLEEDYLCLNSEDIQGNPIRLYTEDGTLVVAMGSGEANPVGGIGASFPIMKQSNI